MEVMIHKPHIWFTSDYHAYHWNILTLGQKRPFASTDDMHAAIADRHNAVVRPGDLVYYLGDFALKCQWEDALRFRRRLMGNFYFIIGNHDSVAKELHRNEPNAFVWMRDLETIKPKIDGIPPITLCHYAMRVWPGSHKNSYHCFGHSHGQLPDDPYSLSMDVGVDCHNFNPVSIEQVHETMKRKLPARLEYQRKLRESDSGRAE